MEIRAELLVAIQIIASILMGGFIGFEREKDGKEAGIRTYAAVCLGATIFTVAGIHFMDREGGSRLIANIVTGIGFLGAGIIYKDNSMQRTSGLTTAATIWATAAVGVAIGYNCYIVAFLSSSAIYLILAVHHYKWFRTWTKKLRDKNVHSDHDHA